MVFYQASGAKESIVSECCSSALQSSKLLLNLLNDLLDMSQIKAGKFKLILDSFNLVELLEEVKSMMQPLARHKQNMICVELDDQFDKRMFMIKSDKFRIRQILINLISNSIKYTHKGRIFLSAQLERLDERYLRISVRDEGIGIKKEFRQNLFQAFGVAEDIENKAKNNPHGVGLGLLISNTIAKNLKPVQFNTIMTGASSIFTLGTKSLQFQTKSLATVKERQTASVSPRQHPALSHDVGLQLNEEIEVGSEFYFSIFNYATQQQHQQYLQSNVQVLESPNQAHAHGYTPRNRNISGFVNLKRSSIFVHDDAAFSLAGGAPSLTGPHDFAMQQSIVPQQTMTALGQSQSMWKIQQQYRSLEAMESEGASSKEDEETIIAGASGSLTNPAIWGDIASSSGNGGTAGGAGVVSGGDLLKINKNMNSIGVLTSMTATSTMKRSKSTYRQGAGTQLSGVIAEHAMKKDEAWRFMDQEIFIMVVDDDQFSAMALKSKISAAFKTFNRNVAVSFQVFYSGAECIEELMKRDKVYSFMFIDCQMPGMDGYETVAEIDAYGLRMYMSGGENENDEESSRELQQNYDDDQEDEDEDDEVVQIRRRKKRRGSTATAAVIGGGGAANHESANRSSEKGLLLENMSRIFDSMQIVLCSGMPKEDHKFYEAEIPFFLLKPIDQQSLLAIIKQTFEEAAAAALNNMDAASTHTPTAARRGTLYQYSIH